MQSLQGQFPMFSFMMTILFKSHSNIPGGDSQNGEVVRLSEMYRKGIYYKGPFSCIGSKKWKYSFGLPS